MLKSYRIRYQITEEQLNINRERGLDHLYFSKKELIERIDDEMFKTSELFNESSLTYDIETELIVSKSFNIKEINGLLNSIEEKSSEEMKYLVRYLKILLNVES